MGGPGIFSRKKAKKKRPANETWKAPIGARATFVGRINNFCAFLRLRNQGEEFLGVGQIVKDRVGGVGAEFIDG